MSATTDTLVARAAHAVSLEADRLILDVVRAMQHGVPELWATPEVARMTTDNTTENVRATLAGLEQGAAPERLQMPAAEAERARRLARHGTPVSVMLRAFRIGQEITVDRLLQQLPRLTDDAELINAAARKLASLATGYIDLMCEQGVAVYEQERDRRMQWRLAMVNEASMRIGTTLDIARTAQELAELGARHFADLVAVDLLRSELLGQNAPQSDPLALQRIARVSALEGDQQPEERPAGVIRSQQVHTYPDGSPQALALATAQPSRHHGGTGSSVPPDTDRTVGALGAHSTLVVPLRARDRTLGVAQFIRSGNPNPFDDEDLLLAQEISARAAVAIDNARRYTHVRAVALTLQRSLLPQHTAEQSAVDVACRYLPAGAETGVGGDWFDVIPLSGTRVALVVGDVVGHGIHAAATMGRLRTAVRTLADMDLPPDELLTHLDDVVLRLNAEAAVDAEEIGATCLYAVYDPVSRQCSLARAGHVLPIVVDQDGTADLLDLPPGPPLGLGGLPFETAEVVLPAGTLLALYTDGLLEARDQDLDSGISVLRKTLARPAPSLDAMCDAVLEAMLPADRPHDDVALLLARTQALGATQVVTWDLAPDPAVVSSARSNVTEQLSAWGLEELDFTTELVVSELITNAIRYGRPPIRLRLILPEPPGGPGKAPSRTLMCEVSDASNTTPHLRRARIYDEGGRGLLLVAQLAEHWGTRHARRGKTVWAELNEHTEMPALAFA